MNDRSEFAYAHNTLTSMLTEFLERAKNRRIRLVLQSVLDIQPTEHFDLYLTCFCEAGDLLSQWRGYGSSDSRYCIKFHTSNIRRASPDVSEAMAVIYDPASQRQLLERMLGFHFKALIAVATTEVDRLVHIAAASIFMCAFPLLVRFKNSAFVEEREWRFVFIDDGDDPAGLGFFPSAGIMKPFRRVLSGGVDDRLPIAEVIAGASRSDAHAVRSARLLLDHFGYTDVPVRSSVIPLVL